MLLSRLAERPGRSLKVLLIAPGVSIHSQRFLDMLLGAGHSVVFADQDDPKSEGAARYGFIGYPGMRGLDRLGLRTVNRAGQWYKALQLRAIWKRVEPDIVHLHWVDVRAIHCARAGLHPLVFTCWGSDINNLFLPGNEDAEYRRIIQRALAAADHVTADSPEVLERCDVLAGKKINSGLFHFGIDLNRFKPAHEQDIQALRSRLEIPADAKVVLSPRALRPLMGHHHVLEAFARLTAHSAVPNTVLALKRYLASTDGYEATLRLQVRKLGLENRIRWLDPSRNEDMPVEYSMADVVINYPERDAFPVTLFEAAACRRSVVTSDLDAYRRVFGEGTLWTVPPADSDRLAEVLKGCLSEAPATRAARLEAAFQVARERGDQRRCFAAMEQVYQTLARISTSKAENRDASYVSAT